MFIRFLALNAIWIFSTVAVIAQDDTCSELVLQALDTASVSCSNLDRNQACYGNMQIDVTGRGEEFVFESVGDVVNVDQLQQLTAASYDEAAGVWGIGVLSLQANLPDTLPGQNLTAMVLGEVQIENAVVEGSTLPVTTNASTRVRSSTDTSSASNVLATIPAGVTVVADGRSAAGEWLRIRLGDFDESFGSQRAWVAAFLVDGDSERMTLSEVEVGVPVFAPMQAFYLKTGIGETRCAELPPDGLLVQTPQGEVVVSMQVNGVDIWLGSTAFLQAKDNQMSVAVVEGRGSVSAEGSTRWVPEGTFVEVPLSEDGRSAVGAPSPPAPYNFGQLSVLPVSVALPRTIQVAPPVPEESIEEAVTEVVAAGDFVSGRYTIQQTQAITHIDTTGANVCASYLPASWSWVVDFGPDCMYGGSDVSGGCRLAEVGPGSYGFQVGDGSSSSTVTITWLGPAQFQLVERARSQWQNAQGQQYEMDCEIIALGTLVP